MNLDAEGLSLSDTPEGSKSVYHYSCKNNSWYFLVGMRDFNMGNLVNKCVIDQHVALLLTRFIIRTTFSVINSIFRSRLLKSVINWFITGFWLLSYSFNTYNKLFYHSQNQHIRNFESQRFKLRVLPHHISSKPLFSQQTECTRQEIIFNMINLVEPKSRVKSR